MVSAMVIGAHRGTETRRLCWWRAGRQAGQTLQRRQQEQDGADIGGNRVSGQADHRQRTHLAEHHRFARAHRDLPEIQRETTLFQPGAYQIVVTNAGAPGGDEYVGASGSLSRVGDRRERVASLREDGKLGPVGTYEGRQHVRIGTDDAASKDVLAGQENLVAGREDGDPRTPVHL